MGETVPSDLSPAPRSGRHHACIGQRSDCPTDAANLNTGLRQKVGCPGDLHTSQALRRMVRWTPLTSSPSPIHPLPRGCPLILGAPSPEKGLHSEQTAAWASSSGLSSAPPTPCRAHPVQHALPPSHHSSAETRGQAGPPLDRARFCPPRPSLQLSGLLLVSPGLASSGVQSLPPRLHPNPYPAVCQVVGVCAPAPAARPCSRPAWPGGRGSALSCPRQ